MNKILILLLVILSFGVILAEDTAKDTCFGLSANDCKDKCIWVEGETEKSCILNPCRILSDKESCKSKEEICVWRPREKECRLKSGVSDKNIWKYKK